MAPITQLLLGAGPTLIRLLGGRFGNKGKEVADKIANAVEIAQESGDAETTLDRTVAAMTSEEMGVFKQLKVELAQIAAEREKNQLDHNLGMYTQEQQTQRTEVKYGTDYVKETRPRIARITMWAAITYVLLTEVIGRATKTEGADWQIATALFTPALAYMGARTVDAFSKWKTAPFSIPDNSSR